MFGLFKREKKVSEQVIETMSGLITSAFGLIAALAWNDAIKAVIEQFFPAAKGATGMVIYAVVITIIAVMAAVWIGRIATKIAESKIMKKL